MNTRILPSISGLPLTLGALVTVELLARAGLTIPNPSAIFLLSVVFCAFTDGLRFGLISAAIAWLYIGYFFSLPGQPFQYTDENFWRVMVWAVTTPAMVVLVGILKRRADRALETALNQSAERERMEEMRHALYQASLEMQGSLELQERLRCLLQTAQTVLELNRVNILLADQEERWLQAVASLGSGEPLEAIRVPIGPEGGGIAQAYLSREPIVWQGQGSVPEGLRLKTPYDQIEAFRSHVFANVPLVVQGRVIGILGVSRKDSRRPLEPETLELLQLFAGQAAIAIENARLYERVREYSEELEQRVEKRTRALREAQVQLVQSAKLAAVGTLAAGVAHELKQPLTVIRGYAQTLVAEDGLNEETRADLNRIEAQTTRMAQIIDYLRDFARQSKGTFEPLALNEVIASSLTLLNQQLRNLNIEVVMQLDPTIPKIEGDRLKLEQVFVNLITNARDAMRPQGGGCLTVTARVAGSFVEVACADKGPGIPPEIQDQIFDPFFTTKEVGQGTGLGLSICYAIMKEHGGDIRVENRPEGGAVFMMRFPMASHSSDVEGRAP